MALISNIMDKIGIRLGFRQRDKMSKEPISEYMIMINSVFNDNFNFTLFNSKLIAKMRLFEPQFKKKKGDIPFEFSKEILDIFYDLRAKNLNKKTQTRAEN